MDLTEHTYVEESDLTFAEFGREWLGLYSPNVKVSTVRIRKNELGILNQYLANVPIQQVTRRQYARLLADMDAAGFAVNTISGVHTTARMIFKKAREFNIIRDDPTEFVKPPRKRIRTLADQKTVPRYLEKEELSRFLRCAYQEGLYGDYAAFMVLAYTGMRVGELCALEWDDVDFEEHTIRITKTLYTPTNHHDQFELLPPKTPRSYRTVEVGSEVLDALHRFHRDYLIEYMRYRRTWYDKHHFIFTGQRHPGYPIQQKQVQSRIDRLCRYVKLPVRITPHIFRHTHTSLLAEAGIPLHEIMDRLGHADDMTTRLIYLHITKERKHAAADAFSALMRSAK